MPELNHIYTGDCLEIMASWPENCIGCILTSPPWNVGLKYEGFDDNKPEGEFQEFNRQWLKEAARICCNSARIYTIVNDKMKWWLKPLGESVGLTFVQELTWCKSNFVGHAKRVSEDWNYMSESILLFRKGKRTPMLSGFELGVSTHNWFVETTPQSNTKIGRIHPAQLPLSLCLKILSRTPGEPILDPFAGSGQILKAARILGRSYIGIEIVPSVAERAECWVNAYDYQQELVGQRTFDFLESRTDRAKP